MQGSLMQKFGKVLLIGLVGLLVLVLLLFFVRMLVSQGRGNTSSLQNGMTQGRSGLFQGGDSDFGMMGNVVGRSAPASVTVTPGQKMMIESEVFAPSGDGSVSAPEEKKVMKNGHLNIRVQNADETSGRIVEIASGFGGSVTESNFSQGTNNVKRGSVTVKVPVAKFEEAFGAFKKVATLVESESITGTDVTAQYIDLSARLKNKKAQEEALQNILNRAEKVSDIIDITNELGTVRGEIESLEGQVRYLDSQTDMASITIFIVEDPRVTGDRSFRPGQTLAESVKTLLSGLGSLVTGIIAFAIVGVPLIAVYGLLLWGVFRGVSKLMKKLWN